MNTFEYPGSSSNFRAFMDTVLNPLDKGIWHPGRPESLKIIYDISLGAASREGWIVQKVENKDCCATVMSYGVQPNRTIIYIHDGVQYYSKVELPDWQQQTVITPDIRSKEMQPIREYLDLFLDELTSRIARQLTPRSLIPKKPENRKLDAWFDYFYECRRLGIKITLREISIDTSYNYDYVRQCHLKYKEEHRI